MKLSKIPSFIQRFRSISIICGVVLIGSFFSSCGKKSNFRYETLAEHPEVKDSLLKYTKEFYSYIEELEPLASVKEPDEKKLQDGFLELRLRFKKFEWAVAYFMGGTTEMVNGPPDPEVENADLLDPSYIRALSPSGLQVMEELIFPEYDEEDRDELLYQFDFLKENTEVYISYFSHRELADWRILDALKTGVFRILTMGITGFDNELTLNSTQESARSLTGILSALRSYATPDSELIKTTEEAITYLENQTDFDTFDRAAFIIHYGNPITRHIAKIESTYNYPIKYNRILRQEAETLFDEGAYNVNAFAPGKEYYISPEKVILGEKLFFDPNLSGSGTRSCATCHPPTNAFTDGLSKNTSLHDPSKLLDRHTPTLLNAGLQSNYFFDMRTLTLEDQAKDVIHNSEEMDGSLHKIVDYLKEDKSYVELFAEAFPQRSENPVDSVGVLNALASYVRSLIRLDSRFDQYMRGDSQALTEDEIDGFNLFMGKAKCATCHFMPLFNGLVPPKFMESEAEIIGVPLSRKDSIIDPDTGWYAVTGVDYYKHAFKTPTVRNSSKTAPYMHNGIYNDLEEVMEFYNNAGAVGLGIELENQTLPEDSLQLSDKEIKNIILFIESLEDL